MANSGVEPIAVAIDGPAGSGKSSVSKAVAVRLGFGVLDTGAGYRSLAWLGNKLGTDPQQADQLAELFAAFDYATDTTPGEFKASVAGEDVTSVIRQPEISASVSKYSAVPAVREFLNNLFAKLIATDPHPGIVIEGRDITTVVAPTAPVRIILTASPLVRAQRRAHEFPGMDVNQVAADIAARDAKDSAVVNFLTPAAGVTLIDTSDLDFEGSIAAVIAEIDKVRNG